MIKVGIIGVTGYTGINLLSLLLRHPQVKVEWITSETYAGKHIAEVYPHLKGQTKLVCKKPDLNKLSKDVNLVFIALPHGLSMEIAPKILSWGAKVIDLGADYRIKNKASYEKWYALPHKNPNLLKDAVYGLPEIHRLQISKAKLVANPGCYATSSILGAYPLIKAGLADKTSIIIDAKSGVSGAGRSLTVGTHFSECNEDLSAYKVGCHRHTPEIEQELLGSKITFVPHLIPMDRGILATIYIKLKKKADALSIYKKAYQDEQFVRVLDGTLPKTKSVKGTNFCDIAVVKSPRPNEVIIISVIDNLMKGASSQAVQNLNIMFGFEEQAGLLSPIIYP